MGRNPRVAWGEAAPPHAAPNPGPRHPASPWGWKWACGQAGHSCGELDTGPAVAFLGQRFTVQGPGPWSWWGRALEELKWGPGPWSELGEPQGSWRTSKAGGALGSLKMSLAKPDTFDHLCFY